MKNYLIKICNTVLLLLLITYCMQAQVDASVRKITTDPGFNRSIEKLEFSKDRTGKDVLKISVALAVTDKSKMRLNMNFDVVVTKNGRRIKKISQGAVKGGAITCAVTCAGNCPSIFGDGVCHGCSCDYNNWLSAGIGESSDGDVYEVKLVKARGGQEDKISADNAKRIVYKSKVRRR